MRSFAKVHSLARAAIAVAVVVALPAAPAGAAPGRSAAPDPIASAEALATLKVVLDGRGTPTGSAAGWRRGSIDHRPASLAALADLPFTRIALTADDAAIAHTLIWTAHVDELHRHRARELAAGVIRDGALAMPFTIRRFSPRPARGHSLWISLHGGGGVAPADNDAQWRNQQGLYRLDEGYYVAPRAPSDAWNMWSQDHVERMLRRLIEGMIAVHGVDPDRVYVLGYGAGGDGVYQLAPHLADAWAGAAMMAGHPNGASPLSLRNVAFAVQVGALDTAYGRNLAAQDVGARLDALRAADPGGYPHLVTLHPDKGAWMELADAAALPWLAGFRRDARPARVVWDRAGGARDRSYWLAVPPGASAGDALVVAARRGGQVVIETAERLDRLAIRLDDRMADLDRDVTVIHRGAPVFAGRARRTMATMLRTLADRGDPALMFDAEIVVELALPPAVLAR